MGCTYSSCLTVYNNNLQAALRLTANQIDLAKDDTSEETSIKPKPFLAFSKPGSFLDSPSTTSQPQPSSQPRRRQPKQQDDNDEEEVSEPKAEPEAGHHGKGNPRTHAFHSCKNTKNLPLILLVSH